MFNGSGMKKGSSSIRAVRNRRLAAKKPVIGAKGFKPPKPGEKGGVGKGAFLE